MDYFYTNLKDDLYDVALISPANKGASTLYGVSGYASATFAKRHLDAVPNLHLKLIIGMPGQKSDLLAYLNLRSSYGERISIHYLNSPPPVHCKLYAWYDLRGPVIGFSGSANYSQYGFIAKDQINQLVVTSPSQIRDVFSVLLPNCISAENIDPASTLPPVEGATISGAVLAGEVDWISPGKKVRISFLPRNGVLPVRSGLNWGQRPEYRRDPNQAYLSLRKDVRNEGFLPPLAITFTLLTDDGKAFDCVVAQQGRKAIHSTNDNSELGKYFRARLGLPSGALIKTEDLVRYGRTDYTLEKLNEETFLLDFSSPKTDV